MPCALMLCTEMLAPPPGGIDVFRVQSQAVKTSNRAPTEGQFREWDNAGVMWRESSARMLRWAVLPDCQPAALLWSAGSCLVRGYRRSVWPMLTERGAIACGGGCERRGKRKGEERFCR